MIATEAAAEGINLQFCNLVVNYDMPWNPQRIEQRIGRCHRYGQKYDVVVVNFLNKSNAADERVYQLLHEKFKLFDGVFGASDEVLGAVESGVDFEKRIAEIYQKCRTQEQIQFEFDQLQGELEAEIVEGQKDAREKLLNNFDQEVVEKVRMQSAGYLDRFNYHLWLVTRAMLRDFAQFDEQEYSFRLHKNPFAGEVIHAGPYRMGKPVEDVNTYRVGHPLAQHILKQAMDLHTPTCEVTIQYSGGTKKFSVIEPLVGKSGWLMCGKFSVRALEEEDHILLTGMTENGEVLDTAQLERFFDLPAVQGRELTLPSAVENHLNNLSTVQQKTIIEELGKKNANLFEVEIDKLDHWADDRRISLRVELEDLDEAIKETRKAARLAPNLPDKLEKQQALRKMEARRNEAWHIFDTANRELDKQKDDLLDDISKRLEQNTESNTLFVIHWKLL